MVRTLSPTLSSSWALANQVSRSSGCASSRRSRALNASRTSPRSPSAEIPASVGEVPHSSEIRAINHGRETPQAAQAPASSTAPPQLRQAPGVGTSSPTGHISSRRPPQPGHSHATAKVSGTSSRPTRSNSPASRQVEQVSGSQHTRRLVARPPPPLTGPPSANPQDPPAGLASSPGLGRLRRGSKTSLTTPMTRVVELEPDNQIAQRALAVCAPDIARSPLTEHPTSPAHRDRTPCQGVTRVTANKLPDPGSVGCVVGWVLRAPSPKRPTSAQHQPLESAKHPTHDVADRVRARRPSRPGGS